jgi:hypothetical protein
MAVKPSVVRYVARILGRMAELSQPGSSNTCNATNNEFASPELKCAFTLDWDFIAGLLGDRPDALMPKFGALMLPGSTMMLDRTRGTLIPCTPATCVHAVVRSALLVVVAHGLQEQKKSFGTTLTSIGVSDSVPVVWRDLDD